MIRARVLLALGATSLTLLSTPSYSASASFLQMDTTTKGNWKGVYGQDGNVISQHSVLVPAYSTFDPRGVSLILYDLWSTDPRALLKQYYSYSPTERVESWFHTVTTMDFLVSAADGQSHRIALYFCDYDYAGRSITVQAIDATTNAVYDSRALTSYTGGIYLVYNYSGSILFRVINNNPGQYNPTASLSALFWGGGAVVPPPPDTTPPTVSIQSPPAGAVSGTVAVTANASDNVGVGGVQYLLDNANLGPEQTSTPYTYAWDTTQTANGPHVLTAIARDAAGNRTTSAAISLTVNNTVQTPPATSGSTASYLGTDSTTLGNWKGVYGQDGNVIALHSVLVPAYSTFDPRNVSLLLYDLWSTDPRALLRQYYSYSPTERIASYFQVVQSMDFLVSATDGAKHRIALYFCDYDRTGRSITVQALDATTSAVLDSRMLTNYTNGLYLIYNYSGQILFRVINNNPGQYNPTATLSALFWGGSGGPPTGTAADTTPPTVSIAAPASGTLSGTVSITANASDASGIASVQYKIDGANLGGAQTAAPYPYSWNTTTATNGQHNLTAVATDGAGNTATSAAVTVTVNNAAPPPPPPTTSGNSVTFLGIDAKTIGNWKGVYGQDGNFISQSSYDAPAYSIFNPINTNLLLVDIWSTDPRAPLKYYYAYSPTERVISQYYNRFYMDFQVTTADNQAHRIALYFCDWQPLPPVAAFSLKRSITVQAVDTDTGTVFNTQVLTDYTAGLYLVYNYKGNVTFHIVNNYDGDRDLPNANISSFFWGGSGLPAQN
jgi:hypothetical protein